MRKFTTTFLIIAFAMGLYSISLDYSPDRISIKGDFELEEIYSRNTEVESFDVVKIDDCSFTGLPDSPLTSVWSKLVALPNQGNFHITSFRKEYDYYELDSTIMPFDWEETGKMNVDIYESDNWFPEEIVIVSDPVIMRDSRFCQISIYPMQYNPKLGRLRILKDVNLELILDEANSINPKTTSSRSRSTAFEGLYSSIIGNPPVRGATSGVYLIITPEESLEYLQSFKQWKERLGFETHIVSLESIGTTELNVYNYIQSAYYTWDSPPDYVILAGDVNGNFVIPTFTVEGYYSSYDVTDHSYTLLEGDDYFPDLLIGRLSFQSINELLTIINKLISYESAPYLGAEWFDRAVMATYIDEYWMNFFSAWETKKAVREKLLDYTYTDVDTFYIPFQNGTYQFMNMINQGCTFINYRGAGAPNYWWAGTGPLLGIDDILQLNNGYMLPMVTSITCGGGNFGDEFYDSCLGETWLVAGTPSVPKGAIGFIGPSELDTKTPFNNANDMGIYTGITQEGLLRCGEMLLRGKMELYNNYPMGHDMDGFNDALDSDQFYFYVYNLLGDPGLAVWTDTPEELTLLFEELIPAGSNYLNAQVAADGDLAGFTVALTTDEGLLATAQTDESGSACLNYNFTDGTYSITASKYGFIPETGSLDVNNQSMVALSNVEYLSSPISGSTLDLEVTIQNLADIEATDISAQLVCEDPLASIVSGAFSVTFLEAGDTFSTDLELQISPVWMDGYVINTFLEITSSLGDHSFILPITLQAPELIISDIVITGDPQPGETSALDLEFFNAGSCSSSEVDLLLESNSDLIQIGYPNSSIDGIEPDATGITTSSLVINISENAVTGEIAELTLHFLSGSEEVYLVPINFYIGRPDTYTPTFDSYGYRAIESSDVGNFTAPVYDWIEISPNNGGNGTQIYGGNIQPDGFTDTIDLPFTFTYYGVDYDQAAVCSNGYISFASSNLMFFRNRTIPSGSGPAAMIAPFWDHIKWGDLFSYYDEENHRFIIQWEDWQNAYNPYQHETFQVILYDPQYYETPTSDGPILFQYKVFGNIDQDNNYATVGIEDHTQTEGLLLSYANIYPETMHEIEDETAILFTTGTEFITDSEENEVPENGILLKQNYPNPFNPTTNISFVISSEQNEQDELPKLVIYNLKGQMIRNLPVFLSGVEGDTESSYNITWNGDDDNNQPVPSGIYFYKLTAGEFSQTRKMLLLK